MNTILRWSVWAIVLQSFLVEGQSGRRFELDVRLETYRNPTSRLEDLRCCNGGRVNCQGPCNNHFSLCAGPAGAETVITSGLCPYGRINFTSNSDDITFSNGPSIVPGSLVANPILFLGRDSESLPNNLELDIEIFHIADNRDLELVERFTLTGSLTPSDTFGLNRTYTDRDLRSPDLSLMASFRARCSPNYVGTDCGIFCPLSERYTCDPVTGEIRCNTGYINETTNCSVCVPAPGCNTTNGYCTTPGECICMPGFTGELCDTASPAATTARGGLSRGGVAGLVIALLLILIIVVLAVGVGIVFYVYQPWSNGWFGLEAIMNKRRNDAMDNPVYETEVGPPQNKGPPPVQGVKYTPVKDGVTGNGHVHLTTAPSVDDDNPLYASSSLERILNPGQGGQTRTSNGGHHKPPVANGNGAVPLRHQPIPAIGTLRESSSLENVLRNADMANESSHPSPNGLPSKVNSLPRQGKQATAAANSSLVASQSLDNLLNPGHALNPYGEYGDQTLQRAVSGNAFSDTSGGERTDSRQQAAKDERLFDNPDYEYVEHGQPVSPIDLDYDRVS